MTTKKPIRRPIARQLQEQLRKLIADTPPGGRLPSEPALAVQLGVSRATLREAMRIFETQGLILRRQGIGTFVIPPTMMLDSGLEVLESLQTQAARQGLTIEVGHFQVKTRTADEREAVQLQLQTGDPVIQVSWVMRTPDRPVAYLTDVLPTGLLTEEEIVAKFNGSVLDLLLKKKDLTPATSRTEISAVAVPTEIARAIGIQRSDVVLYFESTLFTKDGKVVDYSHSYYLPGHFKFHVVRRVGSRR